MKWTEERIIEAIQRWTELRGEPPKIKDWRYAQPPHWPSAYTAVDKFGTWGLALKAAGYERGRGRPGRKRCKSADLVPLAKEIGVPVDLILPLPVTAGQRYRMAKEILQEAPPSPMRDLLWGVLTGREFKRPV